MRLKDLAQQDREFISAPSPVHDENNVILRYRALDLLWRSVDRLVRFVIVRHPTRATIFLLCTDLSLEPLQILQLYGYRFKIELGFRQAVHVFGAYAYHVHLQLGCIAQGLRALYRRWHHRLRWAPES